MSYDLNKTVVEQLITALQPRLQDIRDEISNTIADQTVYEASSPRVIAKLPSGEIIAIETSARSDNTHAFSSGTLTIRIGVSQ